MPRPPRALRAFRPRHDALEALNHVSSLLFSLPVPAGTPSAGTGEAPPPASREAVRPIRSDTSLTSFDPRHHPEVAVIPLSRGATTTAVGATPARFRRTAHGAARPAAAIDRLQPSDVLRSDSPLRAAPVASLAAPPPVGGEAVASAPQAVNSRSATSGTSGATQVAFAAAPSALGAAAPVAPATATTITPKLAADTYYATSTDISPKHGTYKDYIIGNSGDVGPAKGQKPEGGLAMMGGGTQLGSANPSDNPFSWMIGRGGGGDFVVLRASDYDVYNTDLFALSDTLPNGETVKPDSVETLVIDSLAAANDPAVIQKIQGAEETFIAGGDQSNYVNFWKDTPVESAINAVVARGVPVGGTSAGLAVMSDFAFTAQAGTITSKEALRDPYDHRVVLGDDFLQLSPYLQGVLTEQHIVPRDRMGRFVTFLARLNNPDGLATQDGVRARGIGVDERAALLVDPDGHSTLMAYPDGQPHYAYFLQPSGAAEVCKPKTPLTYEDIPVHRITAGESFDLSTWSGPGGIDYLLTAVDGQLSSNRPDGAIY